MIRFLKKSFKETGNSFKSIAKGLAIILQAIPVGFAELPKNWRKAQDPASWPTAEEIKKDWGITEVSQKMIEKQQNMAKFGLCAFILVIFVCYWGALVYFRQGSGLLWALAVINLWLFAVYLAIFWRAAGWRARTLKRLQTAQDSQRIPPFWADF